MELACKLLILKEIAEHLQAELILRIPPPLKREFVRGNENKVVLVEIMWD